MVIRSLVTMHEYQLHEVFTVLKKGDTLYAGKFDSRQYPYKPAPAIRCNYYSSMLFLKGKGFIVIDQHEYEVKPWRIFAFNSKQVVGWSNYENAVANVIAFDNPTGHHLHIDYDQPYLDIAFAERPLFKNIFQNLIDQFTKDSQQSKPVLLSGINYLYSLYNRDATSNHHSDSLITQFKNLICQNFSIDYSITQCADQLQISSRELNEQCLQKIGTTAKQYILDLKLTEAKRLLVFTELTAAEISYAIGFEDPSYFGRLFHKKTKYTPTAFRKKYQR